jgi:hypothetical protein
METILDYVVAHFDALAPALALLVDFVLGAIPDRYVKYKGLLRRVLVGIANRIDG